MLVDLRDPTPLTVTEGLLLLLGACDRILYDMSSSLPTMVQALAVAEMRRAIHKVRRAALDEGSLR